MEGASRTPSLNELCRMRLDISLLDELVHEYCIYRGIVNSAPVNPGEGSHVTFGMANVDPVDPVSCLSENHSIGCDSDLSVGSAHMEGSQSKKELLSTQPVDVEVRYPCRTTSFNEDCSTSKTRHPEDSKAVQGNRSRGNGERGKRKRWRGRDENLEIVSEALSEGCANFDFKKSTMTQSVSSKVDKLEIVLGIKELASDGMATEVIEEINALDPDFFTQNPALLFQLKQVEFLKLVRAGDQTRALEVATSHLGPLAIKVPDLLKPMKETLVALLRSTEEPFGKHFSIDVLATSLQVAVGRKLGIEEPQLMKIIKATLRAHGEWFKLQMCKDQFESLLWINSLKEFGSPLLGDAATKAATVDTCNQGSSPVTVSSGNMRMQEDGSSPNQTSSSDMGCDESAILKVMEFLALPRADAIHLLAQYNGNAETVIQQIFA
ncbi:glucose-induced degradation protein 8 homolog [Phtheirospermum japonicum]|uniref:Glucose-induced degradation protein 8 homolog n=1 Tax=Phtheirospermum japonicum TaxID=374723 RepID=A0A830CIB9_9LAMI|nr:glucose-induced degradation protein 8 homolog [Phtheirospermum japonicum]